MAAFMTRSAASRARRRARLLASRTGSLRPRLHGLYDALARGRGRRRVCFSGGPHAGHRRLMRDRERFLRVNAWRPMTPAERVRAYYDDLNSGDADAVARHFTEDAVHYYTRREPHVGARGDRGERGARRHPPQRGLDLEHLVEPPTRSRSSGRWPFDHPRTGRAPAGPRRRVSSRPRRADLRGPRLLQRARPADLRGLRPRRARPHVLGAMSDFARDDRATAYKADGPR